VPILLLAAGTPRSYNTEIAPIVPARKNMDKFEDFGRRIDEELTRLRRFIEEDVAPKTEKRTAKFLREVSEKMAEAASKLESRNAARNPEDPKDTQS
jgi:hypothetical protein